MSATICKVGDFLVACVDGAIFVIVGGRVCGCAGGIVDICFVAWTVVCVKGGGVGDPAWFLVQLSVEGCGGRACAALSCRERPLPESFGRENGSRR